MVRLAKHGAYLAVRAPRGEYKCARLSFKSGTLQGILLYVEQYNMSTNQSMPKGLIQLIPGIEAILIGYDDAQMADAPTTNAVMPVQDNCEYRIFAYNVDKSGLLNTLELQGIKVPENITEAPTVAAALTNEQKMRLKDNLTDLPLRDIIKDINELPNQQCQLEALSLALSKDTDFVMGHIPDTLQRRFDPFIVSTLIAVLGGVMKLPR
jgi:hypothetical protein